RLRGLAASERQRRQPTGRIVGARNRAAVRRRALDAVPGSALTGLRDRECERPAGCVAFDDTHVSDREADVVVENRSNALWVVDRGTVERARGEVYDDGLVAFELC